MALGTKQTSIVHTRHAVSHWWSYSRYIKVAIFCQEERKILALTFTRNH